MSENEDIHGAILAIMESMRLQGTSLSRLKNFENAYNVFERYLSDNCICRIDENICLEYVYAKLVGVLSASSVSHQMPGSTTVCGHCFYCCGICKMDNFILMFGRRNRPLSARYVSIQNMKPSVKSWFIADTAKQR